MPGYAGIDDLIKRMTVDQQTETRWTMKQYNPGSSQAQRAWFSMWSRPGFPDAGATPAALGTTYINAAGGITFADRGPARKYLLTMSNLLTSYGSVGLVDRLVAVGNLSLLSAGVIPCGTPALPRYTTGEGVQAWLEVTTAGGAATVNLESYTNQDGVAGRVGTSISFPGSPNSLAGCFLGPLPLAAGDTGVRGVQSLRVTATSGIICNLVLCRWIARNFTLWMTAQETDYSVLPPRYPRIYDGATLQPLYFGEGQINWLVTQLKIGWA